MGASAGRFLSGVMNILRIFWETSLSDQIPWNVWKLITGHTDQLMMKDSLTKYLLITHSIMQSPRLVMGPGGQFWYGCYTLGFHRRERSHVLGTLSLPPHPSPGPGPLSNLLHLLWAPWRLTSMGWINTFPCLWFLVGFSQWASLVAQTVKNLPAVWETGFNPWSRRSPG